VAVTDVVVVSYNSARSLVDCVGALAEDSRFHVVVVDNASQDDSLEVVADCQVELLALDQNHGFAYGCNRGWEVGTAPYVLFLNPDARIDPPSILSLVGVLEASPRLGAVGPCIRHESGALDLSQRRFPRLRSTYAQALFLHRILPRAPWADEVVHDPALYEQARPVEWISGACLLARRTTLEQIGGWDEGFFMYGEDKDLCRRLWRAGCQVRYEPGATAIHIGGQSAPRAQLLPTLAASRIRYARKHHRKLVALLERIGVGLGEVTHAVFTDKGRAVRAGHLRALWLVVMPSRDEALTERPGTSVPTAVEPRTPNK
jgi:GT2 family glycosyltransferase